MSGAESRPRVVDPGSLPRIPGAEASSSAEHALPRRRIVRVRRSRRKKKMRSRPVTRGDFKRVARLRAEVQAMVDRARAVACKLKGTSAKDCAAQLESLVDYGLEPALTDLTAIEENCALRVAGVGL